MPEPRTLTEAVENLRAAWRDLGDAILEKVPERWRWAFAETPIRLQLWITFMGTAWLAFVTLALLYAIATGQMDWSAAG